MKDTSFPVGRYVLMRKFKSGRLERHAEGDRPKYMEICAKALIAKSQVNKVEHVQLIDSKYGSLIYEKFV